MACRLQMVTFKAPRAENPRYVRAILQNVAVVAKQNMKIHWSNEKVRYFDIWKQQKKRQENPNTRFMGGYFPPTLLPYDLPSFQTPVHS